MLRWRGSPPRIRWVSCSRCWGSPIRSLARCRDLTRKVQHVIPARLRRACRADLGHDAEMIQAPTLAFPHIRHAFFTRDGGVSDGIYQSLNGGIGSKDKPENVRENRAR